MLRDTAVARIKQLLGFKTNLDTEIVDAMTEIQQQLEREPELPDFLRKGYGGLTTTALLATVAVPTDFIREFQEDILFIRNADGEETPVIKDEKGFLRVRYPTSEDPGVPKRYALISGFFQFFPTPDAIYTIDGTYYGKDAVLSTNIENKWLKELPEILIARAGLTLAAALRDKEGLSIFVTMNQMATAKLHQMTTANDMAGAKPVMGGED